MYDYTVNCWEPVDSLTHLMKPLQVHYLMTFSHPACILADTLPFNDSPMPIVFLN
jgi:hypothetical protein